MASAKTLEDMLSSDVDESAVSALVGSLESQLASPTIHVPSQDISLVSVNNNHVNSAPVDESTMPHGQKHGLANLTQGNALVLNSDATKSLPTTSQILGVNSVVSTASPSTNTITVTLAGAVPASGYINQVTSTTTQQALINSAATIAAARGGGEIKIVYPSQTTVAAFPTLGVGSVVTSNVLQPRTTTAVPNGNGTAVATVVNKPGQSLAHPNNTAAISAIQSLANVAVQQQPLLVPTSQHQQHQQHQHQLHQQQQHQQHQHQQQQANKQLQQAAAGRLTVREQLEQKQQEKLVSKPHIVIKQDGVSSVLVNMKPDVQSTTGAEVSMTTTANPTTLNVIKGNVTTTPTVIAVSKPGQQLQHSQSQPVNVVTQMMSNPSILQGVHLVNVNAVRPGGPGNPNQKALAPRVVISNPLRIATSAQMIGARPGTPGTPGAIPNTITLPHGNLVRGTLLLKTDNGQFQLVNVNQALTQATNASNLTGTYRFQSVPQVRPQPGTQNQIRNIAPQQVTLPVSQANQQVKVHQVQSVAGAPAQTVVQTILQGSQPTVSIVTTAPGSHTQSVVTVPPLVHHMTNATPGNLTGASLNVHGNLQQPLTPTATSQNTAASQMSPDTAKKKCKNFLSTLLRLASDQTEHVATNVRNLIQGLVDGNVQPEDFTNQLQRELNSSPQPCLVPFLKKSLPYLRHSLAKRELTIDGVRPPPPNVVVTLPTIPTAIPPIQISHTHPAASTQQAQVRLMAPGTLAAHIAQPGIQGLLPQQRLLTPTQRISTTALTHGKSLLAGTQMRPVVASGAAVMSPATVGALQRIQTIRSTPTVAATAMKKEDKRSYSSMLRDDDDINDVAAMGGVNLVEESARILAANAEFVGTQIRSCKDENFLFTGPLQRRIKAIAAKFGLDEPTSDVAALISHATQERLKNLVEKLGVIAEHRLDVIKTDPHYEVTQDVKGQLKFLEELDRLEMKRHEEQEREILMRAAKSRSKVEDPEQMKLKQKAKEMQRAEMEEMRQREANLTALRAIGPRKKLKTDNSVGNSQAQATSSGSMAGTGSFVNSTNRPQMLRPRVKRVNLRDMIFLLEQEKDSNRSVMLYKSYLK